MYLLTELYMLSILDHFVRFSRLGHSTNQGQHHRVCQVTKSKGYTKVKCKSTLGRTRPSKCYNSMYGLIESRS